MQIAGFQCCGFLSVPYFLICHNSVSCTTAKPLKYTFLKLYVLWSVTMRSNLCDYIWRPFEVLSLLEYHYQCFGSPKIITSPFRRFRKVAKAHYVFRHVCPPTWISSAHTECILLKFCIGDIYRAVSIEIVFGYWHLAWRPI